MQTYKVTTVNFQGRKVTCVLRSDGKRIVFYRLIENRDEAISEFEKAVQP